MSYGEGGILARWPESPSTCRDSRPPAHGWPAPPEHPPPLRQPGITVPVVLVAGQEDKLNCFSTVPSCKDAAALTAWERPYFPAAGQPRLPVNHLSQTGQTGQEKQGWSIN
jgi:hypothetical protein